MTKKITSFLLAILMLMSVCIIGTGSVSADIADLPAVKEGCNRYFFLLPDDWCNEYTTTAGIYWWEGTDACTSWPGYEAHKADTDNVYYYDVPKDVKAIVWNNNLDGGTDKEQDIYYAAEQTTVLGKFGWEAESDYPQDKLENCDGMIFVIDPDKVSTSALGGKISWEGDWYYYYGDGEYGTETPDVNFEDLPPVKEGCNRYFFLLPEELKNEYTNTAGIYWWEGTDACTSWPGYEAHKADAKNVYYYDVPKDVEVIIWNNYLDGGADNTQDIYYKAIQTVNIGTICYDKGENEYYPDGVPTFDGMIFVIDFDKTSTSVMAGKVCLEGDWFYYYGNGEYGTEKPEEKRDYTISLNYLKSIFENNNYDYYLEIAPHFYPEKFDEDSNPLLTPWHYYDMLYAHNADIKDTPDYIVFIGCYGASAYAYGKEQFGEYLVVHNELDWIYEISHYVYVPSEQKVYTLREAWDSEDIDILPAFESGKVGKLIGDSNTDGYLNIKDATYIQKYLAYIDGYRWNYYMDYDNDGSTTIKDATAIQKAIAGVSE